jgi:heat shock protein HslJ
MLRNRVSTGFVIGLVLAAVLVGCSAAEQTATPAPEAPATTPTRRPVDLNGSDWNLTALNGSDLLPDTNITLGFEDGHVAGFAGCNAYGGSYSAADDGTLSISVLEVTAQACLEPQGVMEQEDAYLTAFQGAAAYRVTDEQLELVDAGGELLLVFARKEEFAMDPGDLPRTVWHLESLDGADPVEGSSITLAFHDESHASGQAGCREYTVIYEASGDEIRFPFLSMSGDDACLADEALYRQEGQYTDALTWASNYILGEGRLEIHTERGEVLIFGPPTVEPAVRPEHAGPDFPPTDYGCASSFYMVWSSHQLDGLSQQVQVALDEAGIEWAEATAEAYGEDWFEGGEAGGAPKLCNFSIMETDFHVALPVESLADLDGLGSLLARVLAVLDRFPPEDTPGQQPGRVSVAFVSPGNEEIWLWFSVTEGVQVRENGPIGSALLEALRYQRVGLTAEPGADVSHLDACEAYQDLEISFTGGETQAVVTSYQCGTAHVDSTGQSPVSSSGSVPADTPLRLQFGVETQPESVEVRIYPGAGVSASFFRWPEELPTGVQPVAQFDRVTGPDFEIQPGLSQGEYSMVIRGVWEAGIEMFYALSFALE